MTVPHMNSCTHLKALTQQVGRAIRIAAITTAVFWATPSGRAQTPSSTNTVTSKIQFTETYADTLVYDATFNETNIVTKASASLTATLPLVSFNIDQNISDSRFSCSLGGQSLFDISGDMVVSSPIRGTTVKTLKDDVGQTNGQVTISWTGGFAPCCNGWPYIYLTSLTIAWKGNSDVVDAAARYGGETGPINDTLDFTVNFAGQYNYDGSTWASSQSRLWDVVVTGRNTNTVRTIGRGAAAATYWLDSGKVDGAADFAPPTLTITSPNANWEATIPSITVTGKATDNIRVDSVSFAMQPYGEFQPVDFLVSSNWSTTIALLPGTNTIYLRGVDWAGNVATASRSFFYSVLSPVTLGVNDPAGGSISNLTNGARLKIGRSYSVTAQPKTKVGWIFQAWTDGEGRVVSFGTNLTFVMSENASYQANFIKNPFASVKGIYRGLFFNPDSIDITNVGAIVVNVTSNGAYSAKLTMRDGAYPFAGQLHSSYDGLTAEGNYVIRRTNQTQMEVNLSLDIQNRHLGGGVGQFQQWPPCPCTGGFGGDGYEAEISAQFCSPVTSPTQIGSYNVLLNDRSGEWPSATGYGSVTVYYGGSVILGLSLADVAPSVRVASAVGADGRIPFFSALSTTPKGIVMGWLELSDDGMNDLHSDNIVWAKPEVVTSLVASGARYTISSTNVLGWTDGGIYLGGGNLTEAISASVHFNPATRQFSFPEGNPNNISLSLLSSSGFVSGSFVSPDTGRQVRFGGACLPRQGYGGGFFKEYVYDPYPYHAVNHSIGYMLVGQLP